MPAFGAASVRELATCHPLLQQLAQEVIKFTDCRCHQGARTIEQQRLNLAKGVSWTMNSKHIPGPDGFAHAFDLSYWPMDWTDDSARAIQKHYWFAGVVLGIAFRMGIPLRWGGDWDSDRDLAEEKRPDLVHFELVGR
jgi:peptidoglycan LD-endopeptidase CwlK